MKVRGEGDRVVAAHGNFDSAHVIDTGISVPIDEVGGQGEDKNWGEGQV